jgi:hypothetical protein
MTRRTASSFFPTSAQATPSNAFTTMHRRLGAVWDTRAMTMNPYLVAAPVTMLTDDLPVSIRNMWIGRGLAGEITSGPTD